MSVRAQHIEDTCEAAEKLADSGCLKGEIATMLRRKAGQCRRERDRDFQDLMCSELCIMTEQFAKGGMTEEEVDRRIQASKGKVDLWDMAWIGVVVFALGTSISSWKQSKCNAKELSVLRGH